MDKRRELVSGYLSWWYREGLTDFWQRLNYWLWQLTDFFSVPTLLRTWLAPWKNDVIAGGRGSLGDRVKLWEQNMVTRLVGFFMRTIVIGVAVLLLTICVSIFGFFLVLWMLAPLLIFVVPIIGLVVAFQ